MRKVAKRKKKKLWGIKTYPKLCVFCVEIAAAGPWRGFSEGLMMAQQCLSVVFVRLWLEIWAQRGFFVVGGWKHVSGLHLIG